MNGKEGAGGYLKDVISVNTMITEPPRKGSLRTRRKRKGSSLNQDIEEKEKKKRSHHVFWKKYPLQRKKRGRR